MRRRGLQPDVFVFSGAEHHRGISCEDHSCDPGRGGTERGGRGRGGGEDERGGGVKKGSSTSNTMCS